MDPGNQVWAIMAVSTVQTLLILFCAWVLGSWRRR